MLGTAAASAAIAVSKALVRLFIQRFPSVDGAGSVGHAALAHRLALIRARLKLRQYHRVRCLAPRGARHHRALKPLRKSGCHYLLDGACRCRSAIVSMLCGDSSQHSRAPPQQEKTYPGATSRLSGLIRTRHCVRRIGRRGFDERATARSAGDPIAERDPWRKRLDLTERVWPLKPGIADRGRKP